MTMGGAVAKADDLLSSQPRGLQKRLGFAFAAAIGLGAVIGAGLMRTSGSVIDEVPLAWLVILLWALGGVHVMLAANVASELVTSIPKAGGIFVPVRAAFGDSMGLLSGWASYLAYVAAGASLAIVCADFSAVIFPPLADHSIGIATSLIVILFGFNWLGVREGAALQTAGSAIKFALLVIVIAIAFFAEPPSPGFWPGFWPGFSSVGTHGGTAALGAFAVIAAYQMIYGAYAGWDSAINFVEEDENALTNIPRALALSILAISAVYVLFNLGIMKALDLDAIRTSDLPVALVLANIFGPAGAIAVAVLAIVMASTSLNANIMGGPRILYGMARDGLFLRSTMRVNAGGTPDIAFAMTLALSVLLIFSGGFEFVFRLMGALIIFSFILYDASLFGLRWKQPDLPRPFRAIGYPFLPALLLLIDGSLLIAFIAADPVSGAYMAALIATCIPVGILLHRRRKAGN
ncbi:MAG: APC family permease [Erythrobacter sp.]|nr:APC family permease [Erythrobacter sp.]